MTNKLVLPAIIVSVTVFCFLAGCSGGANIESGFTDAEIAFYSLPGKQVSAGGKPFGNVHELHSGIADCVDCHAPHGMGMGWQTPDRTYCLACHTDKVNHHRNQDCLQCHNTSGGPGGGN